ncbi:MAG TPA: cytochrome c maturation protein CcmE [Gemmatimonadaceae bacterium]|nr:cytochrome c maturation protein CcmE [Gemmatimonadaceae bacterium]
MKPRSKFLLGGALVVGVAGYLMASSIRETGQYYLTPTELSTKLKDPRFTDVGVKVGARVVPGTIQKAPSGKEYAFKVTDGAYTFPVVYRGIAPDTFADSVDVVIGGRMGQDGTFHATELLAKCASRYENAPDANKYNKYKQTPGYKAGSRA